LIVTQHDFRNRVFKYDLQNCFMNVGIDKGFCNSKLTLFQGSGLQIRLAKLFSEYCNRQKLSQLQLHSVLRNLAEICRTAILHRSVINVSLQLPFSKSFFINQLVFCTLVQSSAYIFVILLHSTSLIFWFLFC
jgi:hypothetical protein